MPGSENQSIRRNIARVMAGALLTAVTVATGATPAIAHTALEDSSPDDGARVEAAPDSIVLDFTGAVRARSSRVTVRGPGGERYESGPVSGAADKIVQALFPLGAAGGYEVIYRVVAADGHPLTGVVRFTLTRPGPEAITALDPEVVNRGRVIRQDEGPDITGRIDLLPPWAFTTTVIVAFILVAGAAWYGRRVTDDLD
jgi:copper resistance protein C